MGIAGVSRCVYLLWFLLAGIAIYFRQEVVGLVETAFRHR